MTSSPFFSRLRASAAFILDFLFFEVSLVLFKLGADRTPRLTEVAFFFDWFTFESPSKIDGFQTGIFLDTKTQKKASINRRGEVTSSLRPNGHLCPDPNCAIKAQFVFALHFHLWLGFLVIHHSWELGILATFRLRGGESRVWAF